MYFDLTKDNLSFSWFDWAQSYKILIGFQDKMTLSGSGLKNNGILTTNSNATISGAENCGSLTTTSTMPVNTVGTVKCGN